MPTATYIPLQTITLGATASTVTFGSIPNTYKDLVLVVNGTSTAGTNNMSSRFNSDSGSNYSSVFMGADTGTFSGTGSGTAIDNGAFTSNRTQTIVQLMDYSATDKHKTTLTRNNVPAQFVIAYAGRWANTSAVTTWTLLNSGASFSAGTTFSLYGIAG